MNATEALSDFLAHEIPHSFLIETCYEEIVPPETADSLGVLRECLVKPVTVDADGTLFTAIVPATRELNLEKLRRYLGATRVRPSVDADIGRMAPDGAAAAIPIFGASCGVKVLVPHELIEFQEITFLVGPSQVVVRINLFDFLVREKPDICARNAILAGPDDIDRHGVIVYRLDERTAAKEPVGILLERRKIDRGNNFVGILRLARKTYASKPEDSATIVIDDRI